jgi:hypothetical protein
VCLIGSFVFDFLLSLPMDDLQTSDALTFIPEQIEPVVFEVIESVLKDKIYNEKLVQGWVSCHSSLPHLNLISLTFSNRLMKFAVN